MFFAHLFSARQQPRAPTVEIGPNLDILTIPEFEHTKPLILFGDFNTGKTWLIKRLLSRLRVYNDDISCGGNIHTMQVKVYRNSQPLGRRSHDSNTISLIDTEGFNKPQQHGEADRVPEWDPLVCSVLSSFPGVVIYITNSFNVSSENMLRVVTTLVDKSYKIVVIHNRSMDSIIRKKEVMDDLMLNRNPKIIQDGAGGLRSDMNGHIIEHLFMFQHRDMPSMTHNEAVEEKILRMVEDRPAVPLLHSINLAKSKLDSYKNNHFEFTFATSIKEIIIQLRYMTDLERIHHSLHKKTKKRIEKNPENFRIFEVRGAAISLDGITLSRSRHSVNITVHGNQKNSDSVILTVWTPVIVVELVDSVEDNHARLLYVQIVA